jgi:hypothetical protein
MGVPEASPLSKCGINSLLKGVDESQPLPMAFVEDVRSLGLSLMQDLAIRGRATQAQHR